jgi:hypothetical protein
VDAANIKTGSSAIPAEKVTGPALLIGFSGESLRKPLSESLAASGLAGFAGMATGSSGIAVAARVFLNLLHGRMSREVQKGTTGLKINPPPRQFMKSLKTGPLPFKCLLKNDTDHTVSDPKKYFYY